MRLEAAVPVTSQKIKRRQTGSQSGGRAHHRHHISNPPPAADLRVAWETGFAAIVAFQQNVCSVVEAITRDQVSNPSRYRCDHEVTETIPPNSSPPRRRSISGAPAGRSTTCSAAATARSRVFVGSGLTPGWAGSGRKCVQEKATVIIPNRMETELAGYSSQQGPERHHD